MLEVRNLCKSYGRLLANDHINLTVPDRSVSLLVGPNGAGKSTLLKSIMGLLRYSGSVRINQADNKSLEAKRQIAYVPEFPHLYPLLTVAEHLEFVARAHCLPDWQAPAEALLRRFELWDKKDKLGGALSKGMQQKVSICSALLPEPSLILFDEPLIGLDPHGIKELKTVFTELAERGCSLLISTHILDTVDELWTQVHILMQGRIAASRSKAELDAERRSLEDFFFAITEGLEAADAQPVSAGYEHQSLDWQREGPAPKPGAAKHQPSLQASDPPEFQTDSAEAADTKSQV